MENEGKVNTEIEEMLSALGDPTPENLKDEEDDKEGETKENKEEQNEDNSSEEKEEKETTKETTKEKEEKKEETKDEEAEEAEETDKDKIIENLRQRLNEKPEPPKQKETQEKTEKEKAEKATQLEAEKATKKAETLTLEEQDFIGDLDLDDLTRDKDAFNKILNTVYVKGVNDSKRIATEDVLNIIPDIVKHNLTLLTTMKEASDNFYKENADLAPFKRVVAAVFEEIAAENPEKNYSELMNLTAPEARKRLELHKQAVVKEKGENEGNRKSPRLPGTKSGQRQSQSTKPATSALESEIEEMNKTLRR